MVNMKFKALICYHLLRKCNHRVTFTPKIYKFLINVYKPRAKSETVVPQTGKSMTENNIPAVINISIDNQTNN